MPEFSGSRLTALLFIGVALLIMLNGVLDDQILGDLYGGLAPSLFLGFGLLLLVPANWLCESGTRGRAALEVGSLLCFLAAVGWVIVA